MDKIILKNIAIFANHGAMREENVLGQRFYIDCTLYKSLKKAGLSDDLAQTIHYGEVHDEIVKVATSNEYKLIEALGENICKEIIIKFKVDKILIQIRKPSAPIAGILDYAAIELERTAEEYV